MGKLADRWERRQKAQQPESTQPAPRANLLLPLDITRTIAVHAPAAVTWAFLTDPRNHALVDPTHVNCYLDPEGPETGVGTRMVHVHEVDGKVSTAVLEVVELEPGRRVVTAAYPDNGNRITLLVEGDDSSSVITHRTYSLCFQDRLDSLTQAVSDQLDLEHSRAKAHLEAGWRPHKDPSAAAGN